MTLKSQKSFSWPLAVSLAALVLVMVVMAATPPVSRDALTHHLAVPKLWIQQGRIVETPDIKPSYYPMNLDLLYAIPLVFGNDVVPKYIHMFFGLATAFLIFQYLNLRAGRVFALIGALLLLSLPIVVRLSVTVYVDLGLVFFTTAAFICILEWRREALKKKIYLWAAAFFCGLAMGTKYNGIVVFLFLALLVPVTAIRGPTNRSKGAADSAHWQQAVFSMLIFVTISLLVFSPWAVRNIIWKGNPVYPLFDAFFNPLNPYVDTRLNPFAIRRFIYEETLWETLLVPLRIFFQGQDDVPALFDGRLNPFLLPLAIFGMIATKPQFRHLQFEKAAWGGFALLFIVIVFFMRDMRIRYIAPAIPPLIVLSVFGIRNLFAVAGDIPQVRLRRWTQSCGVLLVLFPIVLNAVYIGQQWQAIQPFAYLTGRIGRDSYISHYRPEYTVIRYANQHLPEDSRIMCVFLGNRRYYFDIDTLFYEWPRFQNLIEQVPDEHALHDALKNRDISHLMIGQEGVRYWSRKNLAPENLMKLEAFWGEYTELIVEKDGFALYRLPAGSP